MDNILKNLKGVCIYFAKNWLFLSACLIVPALYMVFFYNPFKIFVFLTNYSSMRIDNFSDIFNSQFGLTNISFLEGLKLFGLLVILSICVSIALGFIENNMRSGKKNYTDIKHYINDNFLVVFVNLVFFAVIVFVLKFVLSGIIFALHLTFCGLGEFCTPLLFVLVVLFSAVVIVFIVQVFQIIIINVPNMIINGYTLKYGVSSTISLIDKDNIKMLILNLLPFIIVAPMVCLAVGSGVFGLMVGISSFILIAFYLVMSMINFFKLSDTPRYDNRKYYINY